MRISLTYAKDALFKDSPAALSSPRSNAEGLSAKLAKALFTDNAQSSMLCAQNLVENGRVDGIYLSDVEAVCNEQGKEQVVHAIKRIIDIMCNCYEEAHVSSNSF